MDIFFIRDESRGERGILGDRREVGKNNSSDPPIVKNDNSNANRISI